MAAELKIGEILEAEVSKITDFGAFVKIRDGNLGLIHISQISDDFVKDVNRHLKVGDRVKARVIKLGPGRKIDLSLKSPASVRAVKNNTGFKSSDFEEKLKRFLKDSQQSLAQLKKHNEKHYR